ncbi:hypothetical protein METBIDRAFT_173070 [Metschnikowia bicuspidata var. bicuspidata NRRL YB-4993]|uniref:Uncharacterized protein n=1 Tax=Metschnikowia bicuspidata var. bicuspidata NRRL YB-4993 TaxID=869754 RepID=A0A1A0HAZ6_9ASCO|nr:hypothetical protein METBIDRAFT_173070 [Metschnikowia bicuspidata var. bicuspidata NRRL YB-4993]OBA21058.1 hypothetical protein METBIDRAFT_173070 [Metschnikowia bicuspidata var. bicuspidata NRRL YB-4993]
MSRAAFWRAAFICGGVRASEFRVRDLAFWMGAGISGAWTKSSLRLPRITSEGAGVICLRGARGLQAFWNEWTGHVEGAQTRKELDSELRRGRGRQEWIEVPGRQWRMQENGSKFQENGSKFQENGSRVR